MATAMTNAPATAATPATAACDRRLVCFDMAFLPTLHFFVANAIAAAPSITRLRLIRKKAPGLKVCRCVEFGGPLGFRFNSLTPSGGRDAWRAPASGSDGS